MKIELSPEEVRDIVKLLSNTQLFNAINRSFPAKESATLLSALQMTFDDFEEKKLDHEKVAGTEK